MRQFVLALSLLVTSTSALATVPDLGGTYVTKGNCQCLEHADKKPCSVTPPALNVFTNSVLQKNPYIYPAETGATITNPDGSTRSVKMWVYRDSIAGSEFKVRDGDQLEIVLALSGNRIQVTATNKSLAQDSFTFSLPVPPDSKGGEPNQPPQAETKLDESGFIHNQTQAERYENNGTGETGTIYSKYLLMILKGSNGDLDVGSIAEHRAKPDGSWSQPKLFNFDALRCTLIKK